MKSISHVVNQFSLTIFCLRNVEHDIKNGFHFMKFLFKEVHNHKNAVKLITTEYIYNIQAESIVHTEW